MLSVRCLSICMSVYLSACLSVTFVHCGQTVGRIQTKLGTHVGLGPGHIALDGDPAPLPQRGTAPNFRPISFAAKWLHVSRCHFVWSYRPRPRRLCVRWGPRSPAPKGGGAPQFSAHIYFGQAAGWVKLVHGMEVGLIPGDLALDGDPALPLQKVGGAPPNFRSMFIATKRLDE